MNTQLLHLTLRGQYSDCEDPDALNAASTFTPALDIESCEVRLLADDRVAVELAYGLSLVRAPDEALVCEFSATFRLIYAVTAPPGAEDLRALVVGRAVADGWSSWRSVLSATMAWMGVVPLQLPAEAPPQLARLAAELLSGPPPAEGRGPQQSPPRYDSAD